MLDNFHVMIEVSRRGVINMQKSENNHVNDLNNAPR